MDILINVAFLFSLICLFFYIISYIIQKNTLDIFTISFFIISFIITTLYIIFYSVNANRLPLSNQYETMLILILFIQTISLFVFLKFSRNVKLIFPAILSLPILFGVLNLLDKTIKPLMPALRSNWLFFHVLSSIASYSFFVIAGVYGVIYYINKNVKKIEPYIYNILKIAFLFLTIGIITGAIWAEDAWGRYWSWDPKETWSLITWFFYAIILHLKRHGVTEKKFALLLFIGLLFVIFTYYGVNYLLGGLHSYAR